MQGQFEHVVDVRRISSILTLFIEQMGWLTDAAAVNYQHAFDLFRRPGHAVAQPLLPV